MSDGVRLNTLYVLSEGAYLHRDHQTLQVRIEQETKLAVPIHHLQSVAVFGSTMVSPGAMELCAEMGVAVTFLSMSGRLVARVDAPGSGNVLLRRAQFRAADQPQACVSLARQMVAGKLRNTRLVAQRAARESDTPDDKATLDRAINDIAHALERLETAETLDVVRGREGEAARAYFGAFSAMVRQDRDTFAMRERSRRPPLDPINALLSFVYALLVHDCVAALTAVGLDPSVGFLHEDRPGRPSLALDLMEEFRPIVGDSIVLSIVNTGSIGLSDFHRSDLGVALKDAARTRLIAAYERRMDELVTHPVFGYRISYRRTFDVQARLLGRHLLGELEAYPDFRTR